MVFLMRCSRRNKSTKAASSRWTAQISEKWSATFGMIRRRHTQPNKIFQQIAVARSRAQVQEMRSRENSGTGGRCYRSTEEAPPRPLPAINISGDGSRESRWRASAESNEKWFRAQQSTTTTQITPRRRRCITVCGRAARRDVTWRGASL